ncbi:MAG: caspase family protein [Candidatus Thorarchaeota archaeon]
MPALVLAILLVSYGTVAPSMQPVSAQDNPDEGWAVIMEMLQYPEGWTDLPTGHADSTKWNNTLHSLGWATDHIRIINEAITESSMLNALEWLREKADDNDVVVFFVFAHGSWLKDVIGNGVLVGQTWELIPAARKLMAFSTCNAGELLSGIPGDNPEVRVGSVGRDELAWAGGTDEGLPVLGDVFNHFFTSAFMNETADTDGNGDVCAEEAFAFASPKSQEYIQQVVFPAFPEYEELCNGTAPEPVMMDLYGGNLSLQCTQAESPSMNPYLVSGGVVAVLLAALVIIYYWRREHQ